MPCSAVRQRGATRLEIAIVTSATALLAAGALWLFSDRAGSSERATAIVDAETLLSAATRWKQSSGADGCPSFSQLRRDQQVSRATHSDDPWGVRFRIACRQDEIQVWSAGGDRRFKTDDDISVSAGWRS